jgi:cobalt-zinc-cadmium efflux system outer membrane protein
MAFTNTRRRWLLLALPVVGVGCAGSAQRPHTTYAPPPVGMTGVKPADPGIVQAAAIAEPPAATPPAKETAENKPAKTPDANGSTVTVAATELTAEMVVAQVLARNPSLAQMAAAAAAAAARYPQVTSLDDPVFAATAAPAAIGNVGDGNRGYGLDLSQRLPWPGKLALRGQTARAEAEASGRDVEDTRQRLIESAHAAFAEYYLAARSVDVNDESLRLLKEFRANAEARYKTGTAPQQDILQADVETGRARELRLTLDRRRRVAVARINTLSHLPADAPLPPPPAELRPAGAVPDFEPLRVAAFARRPDLQALAARVLADQAAVASAEKEYYPDFRVSAGYATFMEERPLYPQAGVEMNIPLRMPRRQGAVTEARSRLAARRAELLRLEDEVAFQVEDAAAQVRESLGVVRLYESDILPAAEANVKSAQSAYVTGNLPFLSLIEAQRSVVNLRDQYHQAVAGTVRRVAALERAAGGPVDLSKAPPQREQPASP